MSVKLPLKIAGSSERAGLNEPPDAGPIASAAVKMKRPIRSGAITPFPGRAIVGRDGADDHDEERSRYSFEQQRAAVRIPMPGWVSRLSTALPE